MAAAADESQLMQMRNYILTEAMDKAEEIGAAALQDFALAKAAEVKEGKKKIEAGFAERKKKEETLAAIQKSKTVNNGRLEKIEKQHQLMVKLSEEAKTKLVTGQSKEFCADLIVEGLLKLLENKVEVQCRAADKALVEGALKDAEAKYAKLVKDQTGATKTCTLSISATALAADCSGGVVLTCNGGAIRVDNTIDSRLQLVMDQAKPYIRKKIEGKDK